VIEWFRAKEIYVRSSSSRGLTSKGMEANRNVGKWLSYGRGTSGTFV